MPVDLRVAANAEIARDLTAADFRDPGIDVVAVQRAAMETYTVDLQGCSRSGESSNQGARRARGSRPGGVGWVGAPRGRGRGCPRRTFLNYLDRDDLYQ